MERIISLKPDAVHVGACVKQRTQDGQVVTCKTIEEICERLEAAGLTIVEGTH
ncbi:CGGC domain-containing protein [Phascolarctobacterium succinatutens]|uniref:CGGC domain-containing protein n=1 Tax=Phascolarctobacterium succinatutens TaxID=626940 RepID=UPI003C6E55DC